MRWRMFNLLKSKGGVDAEDEDKDEEDEDEDEEDEADDEDEDGTGEASQSSNHCNPRVDTGCVSAMVLWNAYTE